MSRTKNIAINGFGRIGRAALKVVLNQKKMRVSAINDLADTKTIAHLIKYDSVYGILGEPVAFDERSITIGKQKIVCLSEKNPAQLPWQKLKVDIALECTGVFEQLEDLEKHIQAGAKKVVLSAPSKSAGVKTYVIGVNENTYNPKLENIISCASCTTNCYAPITKIMHNNFIVRHGFMATAHAVTNDQNILDLAHKDLRRARTAFDNIIPTTSGSDRATGEVIPALKGKLHTMAMRVPVRVGSVIYAIYQTARKTSAEAVNQVIQRAADNDYRDIIQYETNPIVSSDIIGSPYSAIFDAVLTEVDGNLIKIVAWYDNEWGYANRLVELAGMA